MKTCKLCQKTIGNRRNYCQSCIVKRARLKTKQKAVDLKGGKCQVCGYDKCLRALQFHHLDETQKDFQISQSKNLAWSKIVKELEKCILVCSNCHAEIHEGQIKVGP